MTARLRGTRLPAAAWCAFDWANSAFPTVITTFVFGTYFTQAIAPTPEEGTSWWGWAMGITGLLIAILGPLTGAAADHTGRRKPWLFGFSALCVVSTALLWFAAPDVSNAWWVLALVVVASIGFEMGTVFYNAMLPDVAPPGMIGRISGWAWGVGYIGGLSALVISLFVFVQAEVPPFGLDTSQAEHVRVVTLLVAAWFTAFAWPLFAFVPDVPRREGAGQALSHALADLRRLWWTFKAHPLIARFLIARMIYTDGLNTLFAFGGIYAAGTFGMSFAEVIQLGIAMNVTAGLGAFAFGWMDDRVGPKRTIMVALIGLIVLGVAALVVESKAAFWAIALPIGLFLGPAQSASRSIMARLAPQPLRTEMFGLYALSGKITAFAGPLLLGWATAAADSQRAGMATVLVFLVVGLLLLRRLDVR